MRTCKRLATHTQQFLQAYATQTVMAGAAPRLGKLDASRSALLLCDIQVQKPLLRHEAE